MNPRRKRRRARRPADRAVGYVRASTSKQVLTGDAQRRTLERYAQDEDLELLRVYEDSATSGTLDFAKRPGWTALIADLADLDAGTVLVVELSRVAREIFLSELAERNLDRRGARLVDLATAHLGDGNAAQYTRDILKANSANERRVISERTTRLLADKRQQGEIWNGTAPYGTRFVEGRAVPHEAEQRVLRALKRWRARGLSVRRCRELLIKKGHEPRGATWHLTTVARIVKRAKDGADE